MNTAARVAELLAQLSEIGEEKAGIGLGMTRPAYAAIEAREDALKHELRQLLDGEAP
jgi:hypothetical protein